jgi:hypothetical protein
MWSYRVLAALCFVLVASAASPTAADPDDPHAALGAFLDRIRAAEAELRASPSFGTAAEQAGAYQHLARSIRKAIEAALLQDLDHPYFRVLDFWLREGGDNPDQRYAFSPIRGGEHYRIWGQLGSARRIELQLYAGQPWAGTGRSVGYLEFERIALEQDGSFSIDIAAEEQPGTWLENPEEATTVFVRQIYDDWKAAYPGEVHIDRVGYEGARKPLETPTDLARRFREAADMVEKAITVWPAFVHERYVAARPPNTVSGLTDTYALGGSRGRWMAGGHFDLPPGKALLIKTWPTRAQYQAIQLTDMWFASLEYGNQISSLTTLQSTRSPDGAYYTVISRADPGHANWLDTGGLARGVFLLRYDGVQGAIPPEQHPSAELVDLEQLPSRIPDFVRVSEADRRRARAGRRRHLQIRAHR